MRRFKFSLESVLILRKKTLNDEQKKLASITNVYNKQIDVLNEMLAELSKLQNNSESYLEQVNYNSGIALNYSSFIIKLSNDIQLQKGIIEKTKLEMQRQQEITKKAYIEVKTLENLKEKQKEKYDRECIAEEIKEVDDLVNSRRI